MTHRALGVDVSHWQGAVDWGLMRQHEVRFAFIKATQGTGGVDPKFRSNWANAKEAGLLRGAYHFLEPNLNAEQQALHFFNMMKAVDDFGELPPVLDVEKRPMRASVIRECLLEIQKLFDKRPIIYTAQYIWETMGGVSWADDYPLWVAQYPYRVWDDTILERADRGQPHLPRDWPNWQFWQFSEKAPGPTYGVESAGLDLNMFNGSVDDLYELAGIDDLVPGEPSPITSRPPEIIEQIIAALNSRLPDEMIKLYDQNAVHINIDRTVAGSNFIRTWYAIVFVQKLPRATYSLKGYGGSGSSKHFTWQARLPDGRVVHGSDTIGLMNGKIGYHFTSFK